MKAKVIKGGVVITDDAGKPLPPGTVFVAGPDVQPAPKFRGPNLPTKAKFFSDALKSALASGKSGEAAHAAAAHAVMIASPVLQIWWQA